MTTNRNRLIFWLSMAAAQIGGFIIFKDLADISQWLVQSSRDFTMAVWYNRHWIAGLSLCLFAVAAIIAWRDRRVCPRPLLFFFVAFFAINLYSGLINPNWMF
ncbi:MAG TPA: hypothetical protein QF901_05295, partial [Gammaproteobacteria bacterium]|nr:hypothetical protein [Gammaproteobacteria bacterium]